MENKITLISTHRNILDISKTVISQLPDQARQALADSGNERIRIYADSHLEEGFLYILPVDTGPWKFKNDIHLDLTKLQGDNEISAAIIWGLAMIVVDSDNNRIISATVKSWGLGHYSRYLVDTTERMNRSDNP